jgi:hypothetical protein
MHEVDNKAPRQRDVSYLASHDTIQVPGKDAGPAGPTIASFDLAIDVSEVSRSLQIRALARPAGWFGGDIFSLHFQWLIPINGGAMHGGCGNLMKIAGFQAFVSLPFSMQAYQRGPKSQRRAAKQRRRKAEARQSGGAVCGARHYRLIPLPFDPFIV